MKNFIQPSDTIDAVIGATITSGQAFLVGTMLVVAQVAGVSGDTISAKTDGVYSIPKAVGAISQGAVVYWDDTAKNVTTTSSGNTKCGYAFNAALSADTTANIMLWR